MFPTWGRPGTVGRCCGAAEGGDIGVWVAGLAGECFKEIWTHTRINISANPKLSVIFPNGGQ